MSTSAFRKVTVEDIAATSNGSIAIGPFGSSMKSSLYTPTGVPVIRGNNIGSGRTTVGDFVFVSKETADRLKRSQLAVGDLFFPHRGAIGEVGIVRQGDPQPALMSTSLMRLRVDTSKADPEFVFWFFKSAIGRHEILLYASTVGTPGIGQPLTSLRSMKLPLPTLQDQQQIAAVLNALDDKIELNRRMSATLEEMARALYRSWFVDFDPVHARALGQPPAHMDPTTAALFPDSFGPDGLPKGWELMTAQSVLNIKIGKTPPRKEAEHFTSYSKGVPWLSIRDMGNCGAFTGVTSEGLTRHAVENFRVSIAQPGSVLLSFKLTVGRVCIASEIMTTNEAIAHLVTKDPDGFGPYFLYSMLSQYDYPSLASTSSIATAVNSKTIKAMPVLVPSQSAMTAYERAAGPFMDKVRENAKENRTLADLRDTLLPRLMSGDLRIREAKTQVEAMV